MVQLVKKSVQASFVRTKKEWVELAEFCSARPFPADKRVAKTIESGLERYASRRGRTWFGGYETGAIPDGAQVHLRFRGGSVQRVNDLIAFMETEK